ncbi:hypothetical protein DFR70_10779 [Nocardia tenerifensis]|uniref:Uncharacterized protein n=1 Tax=Nocardia tenerifensis TaxID=228006 RepID=A0A318K2H4_9NOCA|nr:hypothetical protein DFR70_10779 [Nocardia tenerifensis]
MRSGHPQAVRIPRRRADLAEAVPLPQSRADSLVWWGFRKAVPIQPSRADSCGAVQISRSRADPAQPRNPVARSTFAKPCLSHQAAQIPWRGADFVKQYRSRQARQWNLHRFLEAAPLCAPADRAGSSKRCRSREAMRISAKRCGFRGAVQIPWRRGRTGQGHPAPDPAHRPRHPRPKPLHRLRARRNPRPLPQDRPPHHHDHAHLDGRRQHRRSHPLAKPAAGATE